jgi:serine/threonine protein kinase
MSLTHLLAVLPEPLSSYYSLGRVLGVGAYAVVYQIRHKRTAEVFALKVVEKNPMRIRGMLPQLEREVALLEKHMDTPHVVQLLEVTKTVTHIFLRFDLCRQSLEDLSMEKGPMREDEAFSWLREACLGVQGLHASGVVHRDLKPSNFLIDSEGMLCICDFGWACMENQGLSGTCGTPQYSSPETGTKAGSRVAHTTKVDIYGLGATFQHLLIGRVPRGPDDIPKGLSAATVELLGELLDADAEARPSVDELLLRPQLAENTLMAQLWSQWRLLFDVPGIQSTKQKNMEAEISCGLGGFY